MAVRSLFRREGPWGLLTRFPAYFTTAFDLILRLYRIPTTDPAVTDLRESLLGPGIR